MTLFIGFIMYMVITMMTDKNYDHDLVTEAYYAKDLAYQQEIDAEKNANALSSKITFEKTPEGIWFSFPKEINQKSIEGSLQMYRPSNEKLDFQLPLKIEGGKMLVPKDLLVGGHWKVTIDWNMDGEYYMFKEAIVY